MRPRQEKKEADRTNFNDEQELNVAAETGARKSPLVLRGAKANQMPTSLPELRSDGKTAESRPAARPDAAPTAGEMFRVLGFALAIPLTLALLAELYLLFNPA